MERALVKFFTVPSGKIYAYDGMTNRIITVNSTNTNKALTDEFCDKLYRELEENGFVKDKSLGSVKWKKSFDEYKTSTLNSTPRLLLEITKRCNLNCDYCFVSGAGCITKQNADMSEEILLKALDMFMVMNTECDHIAVDFYGGEALIRFDLIKKAVEHIKDRDKDKPVSFGISTNGVLLNKLVVKWLSENPEVHFTCTVNGPYHDVYRKTHSGKGSLETIMHNLEYIKSNYPGVWNNQARFIANVNCDAEKLVILDFYHENIGKNPELITTVDWHDAHKLPLTKNYNICLAEKIDFVNKSYYADFFKNSLWSIHNRSTIKENKTAYVNSCFPGEVKLFVRIDGTVTFCEQVCEMSSIGNIESGISENSIRKLYSDAIELYNKKCTCCWAQRLCENCIARVLDSDGNITKNIDSNFCNYMKEKIITDLVLYCKMVEESSELIENN